ncbi:MAG: methyltransferase domain-containing protein [Flavobacteriales bacterium]|nr:methyltransferase domain-containing protein [Flavobacteriales bacterium]
MAARPTTDFGKESLFNILEHKTQIAGASFLDLFAGTGAISYEFISRGAEQGTCVDMSQASQIYRKKCMTLLGIDNLTSLRRDVFKFIKKCDDKYDIIFADPPYQLKSIKEIPDLIFEQGLLKENGLLIVEHPDRMDFSDHPRFVETRNYSAVHFSFFS